MRQRLSEWVVNREGREDSSSEERVIDGGNNQREVVLRSICRRGCAKAVDFWRKEERRSQPQTYTHMMVNLWLMVGYAPTSNRHIVERHYRWRLLNSLRIHVNCRWISCVWLMSSPTRSRGIKKAKHYHLHYLKFKCEMWHLGEEFGLITHIPFKIVWS